MKGFFHKFQSVAQFEKAYNSKDYSEPWVSYTQETDKVNYNNIYRKTPLTFEVLVDGNIIWKSYNGNTHEISYKKNGGNWISITSSNVGETIEVKAGDKIEFCGNNARYNDGNAGSYFNTVDAEINVYGNIMSLLNADNFSDLSNLSNNAFKRLFYGCNGLISANNLLLPAITLAQNCYQEMFKDCASLTTAPELPATTLADWCYADMFYNCTSLTSAPELPATTLAGWCYGSMFAECSSLTTAPELPATTLAVGCYNNMFAECTSLTTAPVLLATTLASSCYQGMFDGCTSLTTAPELPATTLAENCYYYMFRNCSSLTTAPELPATTLANYCYDSMFNGCRSLNYIKCLATDISATNCTTNWATNVASSGTFVKNPNMSSWATGTSGIPTNWAVQDAQMNPPQFIYVDNFTDEFIDDDIYDDIRDGVAKDVDDWFRKYMKGTLKIDTMKVEPTEYEFNNNTFMFSGKTYYVYEDTNSGTMYGLLPSEKADYYTLHNNSMEYNNMNYKSNYHPFDYILFDDLDDPSQIYDCRSDINQDILVKIR